MGVPGFITLNQCPCLSAAVMSRLVFPLMSRIAVIALFASSSAAANYQWLCSWAQVVGLVIAHRHCLSLPSTLTTATAWCLPACALLSQRCTASLLSQADSSAAVTGAAVTQARPTPFSRENCIRQALNSVGDLPGGSKSPLRTVKQRLLPC